MITPLVCLTMLAHVQVSEKDLYTITGALNPYTLLIIVHVDLGSFSNRRSLQARGTVEGNRGTPTAIGNVGNALN